MLKAQSRAIFYKTNSWQRHQPTQDHSKNQSSKAESFDDSLYVVEKEGIFEN
ncbi:MAG: hypothetical protein RIQ72_362 [Candidatus Parcubacteria bacterium]